MERLLQLGATSFEEKGIEIAEVIKMYICARFKIYKIMPWQWQYWQIVLTNQCLTC